MKLQVLLVTAILFVVAHKTQAQTPVEFKYKSPSYSVHNYKDPFKAAVAKKYNLDKLTGVASVETSVANDLAKRNYKAQTVSTATPASGAVVNITDRPEIATGPDSPANYKRQFRPKPLFAK